MSVVTVYRLQCRECGLGMCDCDFRDHEECDYGCQGVSLPQVMEDCPSPRADGFHEPPLGPCSYEDVRLWRWAFVKEPPGAKGYHLYAVEVPAEHVLVGRSGQQCVFRASAEISRRRLRPGRWSPVICPVGSPIPW